MSIEEAATLIVDMATELKHYGVYENEYSEAVAIACYALRKLEEENAILQNGGIRCG